MGLMLALDRGNESLKVALFDSGTIVLRWRLEGERFEGKLRRLALDAVLGTIVSRKARLSPGDRRRLVRIIAESAVIEGAAYCSVVPRATKEISRALVRLGTGAILEVNSGIVFPFRIVVESPSKVGPDRLAAAAGVVAAGDRDAIIVDAGTAITVDVLSKKAFLGGAIIPGTALMCRALYEGTATLPLVSCEGRTVEPPGINTREAIAAGVGWGATGAVRELVARSRRRVSKSARVWVTGGGGEAIARHLGSGARYERDLVFLGLRHLFELNCRA